MSGESAFMHLVRPTVAAPAASSITGTSTVKIHTSALFQMLEIVSKAVLPDQKRVIGTLLGYRSDDGSEFEVRDAFMVPCKETGDSIVIEDHKHKALHQLYRKAHPKESVLGWFGSGHEIDNTTGLIHDFYSKGTDRAYPFPAVYLNIDFMDENQQIVEPKLSTYLGAAVGKVGAAQKIWGANNITSSYVFTPIPNEVVSGTVTEKLALNNILDKQLNLAPYTVDSRSRDLSQLSNEINIIIKSIDTLAARLDQFSGSDEDITLLRQLSNKLSTQPQSLTNIEELKDHFAAHNQDVIMIEYLTKVVKEQIELSARLTANAESDKKDRRD